METKIKEQLLIKKIITQEELIYTKVYILDKQYLKEIYELRLEINIENKNSEGVKVCKRILYNIKESKGNSIYSILIETERYSKSFFTNEDMSIIW